MDILENMLEGLDHEVIKVDRIGILFVQVDPSRRDLRGLHVGGDQSRFPLGCLAQDENQLLVSVSFEQIDETWSI
jgi:hypothetical protein